MALPGGKGARGLEKGGERGALISEAQIEYISCVTSYETWQLDILLTTSRKFAEDNVKVLQTVIKSTIIQKNSLTTLLGTVDIPFDLLVPSTNSSFFEDVKG